MVKGSTHAYEVSWGPSKLSIPHTPLLASDDHFLSPGDCFITAPQAGSEAGKAGVLPTITLAVSQKGVKRRRSEKGPRKRAAENCPDTQAPSQGFLHCHPSYSKASTLLRTFLLARLGVGMGSSNSFGYYCWVEVLFWHLAGRGSLGQLQASRQL